MADQPDNIYPEFARMLAKGDKEALLRQRGLVLWLYGLSGSGKSTLANALERKLHGEGFCTRILDGDNIRTGLNNDLGFSDKDRTENIRRIAEVAKLFLHTGIVTIAAFITPANALRQSAREIVGAKHFIEVFLKCSYQKCAQRDPKGLYAQASSGKLKDFSGHDSQFEEPEKPDLILDTEYDSLDTCLEKFYLHILPKIRAE